MGFRGLTLDLGFGPRSLTGTLRGRARLEKDKLSVLAETRIERLRFGQHDVTGIRGRLSKAPDSNVLRIERLVGQAFGGRLAGDASVQLEDPVRFNLSVSARDVDLGKFVNAGITDPSRRADVQGKLAGRLELTLTSGKKPLRQAAGEIEIAHGKLYKLPVVLGLFTVVYLQVPGDAAFSEGFMRYHLRNDQLVFREIFLTGRSLSVLGAGTMNLKTDELKLTFLTAPPGKLPPMTELAEDLLRAISNTLVEIRVTGTLRNPKMDTVPLSPLETVIKRLTQPGKER